MATAPSERFQKVTQLEHILLRPDTYIGGVEHEITTQWVLNQDKSKMIQKQISYVPGLFKIYDEILVNAADQAVEDATMNEIRVTIDRESNRITIMNTGKGIPCVVHEKENVYIPQMLFGELLTSSNYDDSKKRIVGGRNGYGAKLANIYSTEFQIEILDAENKLLYIQKWNENSKKQSPPKITKKQSAKGYVKVSFVADFSRFNMQGIDDDIFSLFERRVYDICACTPDKVNVYFNNNKLPIKNFEKYTELYIGSKKETLRVSDSVHRWDVIISHSSEGFKQVSFVNGICTSEGGTHVDHVLRPIITKMLEKIAHKNPNIKSNFIREHVFVFIKATIENPSFSSQTKTNCTSKVQTFGSKYEPTDAFLKGALKLGILDDALALAKHKEMRDLSKTDGKKKITLKGIPKLDDANLAGTKYGKDCTLILTEGDSAKSFAVSGLSVIGRDKYGIFPLRGKLLNVREATPKQLLDNVEINAIKQILGLQQNKEYVSQNELRYGHILILTDADVDGSHIKGLLINFIHFFWPSLMKFDFIKSMITPIIKATKANKTYEFYNQQEYNSWKEADPKKGTEFKIKYYKGLGTSTAEEAKSYFRNLNKNVVQYTGHDNTDDSMLLAFKKEFADKRKLWIQEGLQENEVICYGQDNQTISYPDFVNKDLRWFSIADVQRSIPSAVDGLKTSQRKVLFACRKRTNNEVKVSQLAGYVSTESAYHHGEASLMSTIITLAQNFVGSNTMNLLEPIGQFGTRLMGGKDAASPRYIFTRLSEHAKMLYAKSDDTQLEYLDDDGVSVEPKHYVPVLPVVLINGAEGIGTGYSCSVPCFNPKEVVANVRRCMKGEEMTDMIPWYANFKGRIEPIDDTYTQFISYGVYNKVATNKIEITELPIGRWTQDYKEFLDTLLDTKIVSYENHSTESTVRFIVKLDTSTTQKGSDSFYKDFKLTTNISTKNMHLFDANGEIKKYTSAKEIISDFAQVRTKYYKLRKDHIIKSLKSKLVVLKNKVRFISMVTQEELIIFKKKKDVIVSELTYLKFDKVNKSYDYLLDMKLYTLTEECILELRKQHADTEQQLNTVAHTSLQDMWENDVSI